MKKFLLLSVLILFGCSKDSEGEALTPGDEIIGTHQIIDNPDNGQLSQIGYWDAGAGSTITFSKNNKGSYTMIKTRNGEVAQQNIIRNFDWSFDGQRWNIIEENLGQWTVSFFSFYTMRVDVNNSYDVARNAIFYFK